MHLIAGISLDHCPAVEKVKGMAPPTSLIFVATLVSHLMLFYHYQLICSDMDLTRLHFGKIIDHGELVSGLMNAILGIISEDAL